MDRIASGIWKVRFGKPESITPVQMRKEEIRLDGLEKLPQVEVPPFLESEFVFTATYRGCVIKLPLHKNESIYGFGLQLKSHNQKGKKKHLRVNADPVSDTGDSHAPVPFYVSTFGYGVYVDTARYATFYCGTHIKVRKETEDTPTSTVPATNNTGDLYAMREPEENADMIIEIPSCRGVDVYLFAGPAMLNAIQRYVLFSGGGCLPPYWGLGMWYRAYIWSDGEDVLKLAENFRKERIPCDVLGLEPGWQSHSYSCSYTWDKRRFNNPSEWIDRMKDMNYHINLWEHVFVHPTSPIYGQMKKYAGEYEIWGGVIPDLSIQEAARIFADYHQAELVEKGVSGFKLDECDSSDFTSSPWSFPDSTRFPSGIDGEKMHSFLGVLYQRTILSIFRMKNIRTYCQVRSSHALAASLPFVLYSDLYDHREYIRGLANMGFAGLLWSPEVRQCKSIDDLVRRMLTVVFSPLAVVNAWMIKNPPWYQYDAEKNNRDEAYENNKELKDICRRIMELRMSLIPYLHAAFAIYHFEGIPPFRALVIDYPQDESVYDIDDEYMMGEILLVAPMTVGEKSRRIYLPEGNWYCFWTHKKYAGMQTYDMSPDMETIPVFVKENSLLPLAKPQDFVPRDSCFDITVYAYGDYCKNFELFEEDGLSFDFEKGKYNRVVLRWDNETGLKVERIRNYTGCKYNILGFEKVV